MIGRNFFDHSPICQSILIPADCSTHKRCKIMKKKRKKCGKALLGIIKLRKEWSRQFYCYNKNVRKAFYHQQNFLENPSHSNIFSFSKMNLVKLCTVQHCYRKQNFCFVFFILMYKRNQTVVNIFKKYAEFFMTRQSLNFGQVVNSTGLH